MSQKGAERLNNRLTKEKFRGRFLQINEVLQDDRSQITELRKRVEEWTMELAIIHQCPMKAKSVFSAMRTCVMQHSTLGGTQMPPGTHKCHYFGLLTKLGQMLPCGISEAPQQLSTVISIKYVLITKRCFNILLFKCKIDLFFFLFHEIHRFQGSAVLNCSEEEIQYSGK